MRHLFILIAFMSFMIVGCNGLSIPEAPIKATLPTFADQINEVEVADSMNDVDPSWVLGSIVNLQTGNVRGLDNYLSENSKPLVTPQNEVVFKDLIENSLTGNVTWLSFLQGELSNTVRAELSVIKTSKVTMKNRDLDKERLTKEIDNIPEQELDNYGVIIGYVDFVLSATKFKDIGTGAGASGYGAKINGKWFSKKESTSANHRIVAIYSSLPFVNKTLNSEAPNTDLAKLTIEAMDKKIISIRKLDQAMWHLKRER